MILKSLDGQTVFELRVPAYQFPEIAHDEYDSNWLVVSISLRTPEVAWSSADSCVLIWEGHWLLNWLSDVAAGTECEPEMRFLEPNLEFAIERIGDSITLRILLQENLRPPACVAHIFEVSLSVSPAALRGAVAALAEDLSLFPRRAGAAQPCRPWNDKRVECVLCQRR